MARTVVALFALLSAVFAPAFCSASEPWPTRLITWIVPFPAGGSSDASARPLAAEMEKRLGQRIIIENRGGAGGTIGAAIAAKAPPDGYTFFLGAAHHAIAESLYPTLSYNLERDFIPIAMISRPPHVVVINSKNVPVTTLAELIDYARANPGKLNYASAGNGTTLHLAGELFQQLTGTKLNHVPYRGNGPAMQDLVAGHVDLMFDNLASATSQIREGSVRPLAVAHPTRVASVPDVPTAAEAGLKGFEVTTWYALWAIKGTPTEIVDRMRREVAEALKTEAIRAAWDRNGSDIPSLAGDDLTRYISSEISRWQTVVKQQVVRLD